MGTKNQAAILQLHDLQSNIVGTVGDSESELRLTSTYNSTEFGVPSGKEAPPKYAWLGASGMSSEPSQGSGTSEGCTTRVYGYEADTNRTSLATAKPNSKGECTTEGATEENHSYDTADRLLDAGIKYNEFGDITKLPAADAGGHELASSFYVDGQLEGQTQNGQSNTYELDPEHRTRETIAGTTATITHYDGPGRHAFLDG